jgi:hypothetical protein
VPFKIVLDSHTVGLSHAMWNISDINKGKLDSDKLIKACQNWVIFYMEYKFRKTILVYLRDELFICLWNIWSLILFMIFFELKNNKLITAYYYKDLFKDFY